jgi:hypothetical protein
MAFQLVDEELHNVASENAARVGFDLERRVDVATRL